MARTYDITRRNKTKQRKDRRDKQTRTTNKRQNTKIFPRSYTVFCEIHTEPIRENRQHETTTQKRDEMGIDNRSKFGFQQDKTRTNITTLFGTLQRQQRKYLHNRRMQNMPRNSTLAKTRQPRAKTDSNCQPLPK